VGPEDEVLVRDASYDNSTQLQLLFLLLRLQIAAENYFGDGVKFHTTNIITTIKARYRQKCWVENVHNCHNLASALATGPEGVRRWNALIVDPYRLLN
jgi:hypothetical protein